VDDDDHNNASHDTLAVEEDMSVHDIYVEEEYNNDDGAFHAFSQH
jgi:hypothetical protein